MAPHVANAGYPVHLEAIQVSPGQTHIDSLPMRKPYLDGPMEVIVTIVSKLGYNPLKGLITYFCRGEITQLLISTSQYPFSLVMSMPSLPSLPVASGNPTEDLAPATR